MSNIGLEKFDAKEWYISNFHLFEKNLNGGQVNSIHDIRKAALTKFSELGFPTPRKEEWKYTNVAPILEHKFKIATEPTQLTTNALSKFVYEGLENNLVVFINGHFSAELSNFISKPKGFIVDSLKNVLLKRPDITKKYLGGIAAFHENSFTALNTAFTNDGMFMFVPREMIFETPILILHLADARQSTFSTHPRNLIVAEKGSQVQFIECYHTITNATYFNNLVSEVYIAENAKVKHIKIQEESEKAFHIANTQIQQERNSVYTSVNIDLGGALVR
ncbi:MAG: SufD family Fe-S cluster assembly protein, partial [bacterium]